MYEGAKTATQQGADQCADQKPSGAGVIDETRDLMLRLEGSLKRLESFAERLCGGIPRKLEPKGVEPVPSPHHLGAMQSIRLRIAMAGGSLDEILSHLESFI